MFEYVLNPSKKVAPMMLTTDLSLKMDPKYAPISKRFHENLDEFSDAFANTVIEDYEYSLEKL